MHRSRRTVARTIPIALLILLAGALEPAYAARRSAMEDLDRLVKARGHESSNPAVLVKLSELYLDVGPEGYTDATQRLKMHVTRALELQKDHAQALHMMGRMLDELPWILGGDAEAALRYLKHAVQADPRYEHARLDLAKAYLKRNDVASARLELQTLIGSAPTSHHDAANRYQTEGRALLVSLQERERRQP